MKRSYIVSCIECGLVEVTCPSPDTRIPAPVFSASSSMALGTRTLVEQTGCNHVKDFYPKFTVSI